MADFKLTHHDDLSALGGRHDLAGDAWATMGSLEGRFAIPPSVREFLVALLAAARQEWADEIWAIFDAHRDARIVTVAWKRIPFIRFTVRVRHVEPLFRLIAGPRP